MSNCKKRYGQYMTPEIIANFMVSLANFNRKMAILEPSCGKGIFLDILKKRGCTNIFAYEVDKNIKSDHKSIKYTNFIDEKINQKFNLVIGNPPYIKWKNLDQSLKNELSNNNLWNQYCNSFCDYSAIFIIKSIELLKENGQLIFITPQYWLSTTNSIKLRNYMIENGYFDKIYHFNEIPIFEKVNISTVIFKFIKKVKKYHTKIKVVKYFGNKKLSDTILKNLKRFSNQKDIEYIELNQFKKNENWLLADNKIISLLNNFEKKCRKKKNDNLICSQYYRIGDFCDIGNGMVSGLDKAFQIDKENLNKEEKKILIKVIKAKHLEPYIYQKITNYFLIKEGELKNELIFKEKYKNFYEKLKIYEKVLQKRYKYNRDIKFWEWTFLRNYKLFGQNIPRIFVPCKERISNKNYYRFSFIESNIYPTQDVTAIFPKKETQESIYYILAFLNSKIVFDWLKYNGIVKGNIVEFSKKPIASIPYRKIDFNKEKEKNIHDKIVFYVKEYIKKKDIRELEKIDMKFRDLYSL